MVPMGSNSASGQGQASASQGQASVSQGIQDLASGRDLNHIEQEALTMAVAAGFGQGAASANIGDFLMMQPSPYEAEAPRTQPDPQEADHGRTEGQIALEMELAEGVRGGQGCDVEVEEGEQEPEEEQSIPADEETREREARLARLLGPPGLWGHDSQVECRDPTSQRALNFNALALDSPGFVAASGQGRERDGETSQPRPRPDYSAGIVSFWKYSPRGENIPLNFRVHPNIYGPWTGKYALVDDVLSIVEEHVDSYSGVRYLKLKDDKGWVFDRIPGGAIMCERLEAPPVAPYPDEETDQASGQVEETDQASGQVEELAVDVSSEVAQPASVDPRAASGQVRELDSVFAQVLGEHDLESTAAAASHEVLCTDPRGHWAPLNFIAPQKAILRKAQARPGRRIFALQVLLQNRYTPCVVCTVSACDCDDPDQLFMHARHLLTKALGSHTQCHVKPLDDDHAKRQIMAYVNGAKFAVLIQVDDAAYSAEAMAIGVGSSKRGTKAAAQLALAAFIFSTQVQEERERPDPTEDEAFPRLVGSIRWSCLDNRRRLLCLDDRR